MTYALIKIDRDTFGRSGAGLVYGALSLQLGDESFPDRQWTDFVVVVLSWWCQALLLLLRGGNEAEVRFMDGPFLVKMIRLDDAKWRVILIEAGLSQRVRSQDDVEAMPFIRSVVDASELTLKMCQENNWASSDSKELWKSVAALKSAVEAPQKRAQE